MVYKTVHFPAQQGLFFFVSQKMQARRVAEGAIAFKVQSINRFSRRVKKQPYLFLTLSQGLLGFFAFCNIGKYQNYANEIVFLVFDRCTAVGNGNLCPVSCD